MALAALVEAAGRGGGAGRQGAVAQPARGVRRRRRAHRLARRARRHQRLGSRAGLRPGGPGHGLARPGGGDHGRGGPGGLRGGRHRSGGTGRCHRAGRRAGQRGALARLHGRDRVADERDRRLGHPDFVPGRRREAVLTAGPGSVPGRRRARPARQHPGDAGQQDRRRHHRGQGLRAGPAPDPGLPERAQPGLDEPDRQRGRRHGRPRHAHHPHRAWRATGCWWSSPTPAPASRTTSGSGSSSRSSPPSRSARAPVSGSTSRGGSW